MERLTKYDSNGKAMPKTNIAFSPLKNQECINRLATIEDVLGDDYDLDRLKELVEADRDGRYIVKPYKVFAGQSIWVIEPESRTGVKTKVWKNTVKGFDESGVFYQRYDCPVYHELFEDFGKTWFLNEELANDVLKGEENGKSKVQSKSKF